MFSLSDTYEPHGSPTEPVAMGLEMEPSTSGSPSGKLSIASAQSKNASVTMKWLDKNYEGVPTGHIARETIFSHYCEFMASQGLPTVNAASFGKIIRSVFPLISTRRLGTRGNSK